MIIQSGGSHHIETEKLSKLNDFYGASMTDLNFYQAHDAQMLYQLTSFLGEYQGNFEEMLTKNDPHILRKLYNLAFARSLSMQYEYNEKKKVRQKALDILAVL